MSYRRRLLQGRIDILRAELSRRDRRGRASRDVDVEALTDILSSSSAPQNDEGV